ncbi:hypothetical protein E2C01_005671 [Portunus trituberculatus]|uniref:Uncharacterized protein n=1 Tax=Portunus trituberculatus TaxID=210409 RepID=A0A5B7CUZ2_PORTR|nr:hypothetical protein [Portunus trituberculatus]
MCVCDGLAKHSHHTNATRPTVSSLHDTLGRASRRVPPCSYRFLPATPHPSPCGTDRKPLTCSRFRMLYGKHEISETHFLPSRFRQEMWEIG